MLPHLPGTDCKHWKELAKEYRARANRYTSMIEHAKEDDANEPKYVFNHRTGCATIQAASSMAQRIGNCRDPLS
jgi:hypothetical protein